WTKCANAASMSWSLLAFWTTIFKPNALAAVCRPLVSDLEAGFFGLTRRPITAAFGTSSCSNSSRLGASVLYRKLVPVTLPPGRLMLETRPRLTGAPPIEKAIGMVAVAALAASGAAALWIATITATWRRTRSAASAGKSVQLTLGPAVLHCDIAALDVAGFVETLPDRVELAGSFTVRAAEQADHRHRRLL